MSDLADVYEVPEMARRGLVCGAGWESRWEVSWRCGALISHAYPDPLRRARAVALWSMGGVAAST